MVSFPSETIAAITKFLFAGKAIDELGEYDLVIMLGNHLVELMVDGLAELRESGHLAEGVKVILAGSTGDLDAGEVSEAKRMYELALQKGFRAEDLILEPVSRNTYENLLLAKEKMQELVAQREGAGFRRILCIGQAFLARRAKMCAVKCGYAPEKLDYYGVVDREGRNIGSDSWWKTESAKKRVLEELGRISEYALKGDLGLG